MIYNIYVMERINLELRNIINNVFEMNLSKWLSCVSTVGPDFI